MGNVRKQSISSFFLIYAGFILGAFNQIVLFGKFLTAAEVGLTAVFSDFYVLFTILTTLGSITTFYKFYPLYKHHLSADQNDLPGIYILVNFFGLSLFLVAVFVFQGFFASKFGVQSPLFVEHYLLVIPYTVTCLMMYMFESFAFMLHKTSQSNFITEVLVRIVQTILISIYGLGYIDNTTFFTLLSFMYIPSLIAYVFLVFGKDGIRFNFKISKVTERLKKQMMSFSLFHFSSSILNVLPNSVNGLLIASVSGLGHSAVYMYTKYLVQVLSSPQKGMKGITIATISEAWHKRDLPKIERLYQKTSINLLIIGICLFGIIYPNIPNLVRFLDNNEYAPIASLFLITGTIKIFDMSMGMNNFILGLSKYWKTDFHITNTVIFLCIPLNYFLITEYSLMGAVVADAIILGTNCLLRYIYIYKLFKMQPFTWKSLYAVLIGTVAVMIVTWLPDLDNMYVDVVYKTIIFCLLFIIPILKFELSSDLNDIWQKLYMKIIKRKTL